MPLRNQMIGCVVGTLEIIDHHRIEYAAWASLLEPDHRGMPLEQRRHMLTGHQEANADQPIDSTRQQIIEIQQFLIERPARVAENNVISDTICRRLDRARNLGKKG